MVDRAPPDRRTCVGQRASGGANRASNRKHQHIRVGYARPTVAGHDVGRNRDGIAAGRRAAASGAFGGAGEASVVGAIQVQRADSRFDGNDGGDERLRGRDYQVAQVREELRAGDVGCGASVAVGRTRRTAAERDRLTDAVARLATGISTRRVDERGVKRNAEALEVSERRRRKGESIASSANQPTNQPANQPRTCQPVRSMGPGGIGPGADWRAS